MKRIICWVIGFILIIIFVYLDIAIVKIPLLKFIYPLILCVLIILFRILRGPTSADRIVAIEVFGIIVIGFCILIAINTNKDYFVDLALAWALQSFIGTLALAKYLEGKNFDE